jgi:hypothetical protein
VKTPKTILKVITEIKIDSVKKIKGRPPAADKTTKYGRPTDPDYSKSIRMIK